MHSSRQKPPLAQLFRAPLLGEGDAALRWGRFSAPLSVGLFQSSPRLLFISPRWRAQSTMELLRDYDLQKNAFPKQKRRFLKWPSSSFFARELTPRKWARSNMRSIASS